MSGTTVPIKPGPPVQLQGCPIGTDVVIYNPDPNHAVWVGDSTVAPMRGMKVNALGSVTWNSKTNAYACVDSGVTQEVDIVWSNDTSAMTDPLGVALSVFNTGIPSVLVETVLAAGVAVANNSSLQVDVSKYASVSIVLGNIGESCQIQQIDATSVANWNDTLSGDPAYAGANLPSMIIPVVGQTLAIINNLAPHQTIHVTIVASNRGVPRRLDVIQSAAFGDHWFAQNVNMTNGNFYSMTQENIDTVLQGQVYATFQINSAGGAMTGVFFIVCDSTATKRTLFNTAQMQRVGATTLQVYSGMIALPVSGGYTIVFEALQTLNPVTLDLQMFQCVH